MDRTSDRRKDERYVLGCGKSGGYKFQHRQVQWEFNGRESLISTGTFKTQLIVAVFYYFIP